MIDWKSVRQVKKFVTVTYSAEDEAYCHVVDVSNSLEEAIGKIMTCDYELHTCGGEEKAEIVPLYHLDCEASFGMGIRVFCNDGEAMLWTYHILPIEWNNEDTNNE